MKHWTQKELIEDGYEIENAQITNVSLNMESHGCLCLDLTLEWRLYETENENRIV